jgi:hypothetical protein
MRNTDDTGFKRMPPFFEGTAGRRGSFRPVQPATHRHEKLVPLQVVGIALLLGISLLMPVLMPAANAQVYYIAAVLTLLTCVPLVLGVMSGKLDVFEPIIPISALIGLAFGIRAMYLAYEPANTLLPVYLNRVPFDDFIATALMMAIAAYCALLVGYYVIGSRFRMMTPLHLRPFARRRGWPERAHGGKIVALIAIAMWATFMRISAGEVVGGAGGAGSVTAGTFTLMLLSGFAQCAACILGLYIARGDNRRWLPVVLWLVTLPLTVIQSLAFAGKTPVLLAVYVIMAAHHYGKRRLRLGIVAAGVAVSVLLVFPTVNLFRIADESPLGAAAPTPQQFAANVAAIPQLFAGMTGAEYVQLAAEGILVRSNGADALAMLMKYDVSEEMGDPSLYLKIPLIAFVPRLLWPDKPVIQAGAVFGRLFFIPIDYQSSLDSISIGMYHIGDLYLTFGVAGVLIGMCVLGCLYRLFYQLFDPGRSADIGLKFLYIIVLFPLVNGFESDIPTTFGNLLKSLLVWTLIKAWFDAPVRDRATGASTRGPVFGPARRLPSVHAPSTAR